MVKVFTITNPYNPHDGLKEKEFKPNLTLSNVGLDYIESPWLCVAYIDGQRFFPVRSEWRSIKLKSGDCIYFIPHVSGVISLVVLAVVAVSAVVFALSLTPPSVAETPEPDPVFDLKGQKNQIRIGSPIEDGYGRVRLWPSYATRAYNQFYGNDQFQFQLFCLGNGSWDVEQIYIEDTEIENFQEVTYQVVQPFQPVTLFPDNVETSIEVGQIELYGPNEPEFSSYSGPFVANSVDTLASRLEVDVSLPKGLYFANNDGGLDTVIVEALFEYRRISNSGTPIGIWETLSNFDKTLRTNTPQRFTLQKSVTPGRYEVRAIRIDDAGTTHRAGDTIEWVGLRAFLQSTRNYGDVTMLAIRARATDNLNDTSSNRVNLYATRKLPIYDDVTKTLAGPTNITQRVATRSPVWAMVNILRSKYGGNLEDKYLDLEFLAAEAEAAESSGIYFDWIYDQRTTVWEAIKLPCFINKSIPMLNGSRVSFVRDKPQTLPTFFINPENTISGSFKLEKKLFDIQENDSLEVEYIASDTWKPEVVTCLLPGGTSNNPKRIKLFGVTYRQRAYDLGMYLWYKESKERELVTVKTGMEGYIPTYGDLGRFGSDIPRWGKNGFVKSIVGSLVTLSEEVEFEDGSIHQMAIRGKQGQDLGPFTVTEGPEKNQVIVEGTIPNDQVFFDFQNEPPYFIFGVSNIVGKICRVVNLNPQESEGVTIKAIVDDQGRHADFGNAPSLNSIPTPPTIPDSPVVTSINVEPVPNSITIVTVSWSPALGAVSYILEQSTNGIDWVNVDNVFQTNYTLPINPGLIYVRVAAVNVGIGPFIQWSGIVGAVTGVPNDVTGLIVQPAFTGVSAHIKWSEASQATSYVIDVYTNSILRCSYEIESTDFDFTIDEANTCGAVDRSITFEVFGKNELGLSENAASLAVNNPIPEKITTISSTLKSEDATQKIYTASWNVVNGVDISFYRVWGSDTQGFSPNGANVIFEGLATGSDISISKDINGKIPSLFWRVAAVDVWGDDTNPSDEQTITGDLEFLIDDEGNYLTDGTNKLTD